MWHWRLELSGFCCVRHVFPPHVSIFGLFPVLVKCHYELILVQPCLSNYLWFTCVYKSCLLSLIWSGLLVTSRCILSLCPALMSVKTIIWVYVLVCVSLFLPRVCTVTGVMMLKFQYINYILLKLFHNLAIFTIFDQINAAWVSRRNLFQKH